MMIALSSTAKPLSSRDIWSINLLIVNNFKKHRTVSALPRSIIYCVCAREIFASRRFQQELSFVLHCNWKHLTFFFFFNSSCCFRFCSALCCLTISVRFPMYSSVWDRRKANLLSFFWSMSFLQKRDNLI